MKNKDLENELKKTIGMLAECRNTVLKAAEESPCKDMEECAKELSHIAFLCAVTIDGDESSERAMEILKENGFPQDGTRE